MPRATTWAEDISSSRNPSSLRLSAAGSCGQSGPGLCPLGIEKNARGRDALQSPDLPPLTPPELLPPLLFVHVRMWVSRYAGRVRPKKRVDNHHASRVGSGSRNARANAAWRWWPWPMVLGGKSIVLLACCHFGEDDDDEEERATVPVRSTMHPSPCLFHALAVHKDGLKTAHD